MKRPTKQSRTSRLGLQTKIAQLAEQRDSYLEALETIADILEEVGILDPPEEEEEATDPEEILEILSDRGLIHPPGLPAQQNESQHSEDENPGDEPDIGVGDIDPPV